MKKFTVQITDKALDDMEEIYDYIAGQLQSPENAMRQYNRIADAVEGLSVLPQRIMIMKSEPEHSMGLRQLVIDNFSAFYLIEDNRVTVVRVLYSSSDISKKLLDNTK